MNKGFVSTLVFTLFVSIFFSACSSDIEDYSTTAQESDANTDTTTDTNTTETFTGTFVDAVVQGFDYTCSGGLSGSTTSTGSFTCNVGDTITFELDGQAFSSVALSSTITPYTLFSSSIESAINLARVLQSLDSDGDLTNSLINIDKTLEASLPANLDYSSSTFTTDVEAALGITLVSAYDAQERMNQAITDDGGTIPTGAELPVADAGADQNITTLSTVNLDASGSDASSFGWSFASVPVGSTATLSDANISNPTFVADLNGTYILTLQIEKNNIYLEDNVSITASTTPPPATNSAPVFTSATTISVLENQTSVITLSATDADGDTLTYSISGTDSASFSINSSTGVVTFNTAPDFEVKSSYEIQTTVSDSNLSDTQDLNVTIQDELELPVLLDANLSIDENQAIGSSVGSVSISSNGDSAITSMTLTGTGSEKFDIDASGAITTLNSLDYELVTTYNLKAKATNGSGDSPEVDVVINVGNIMDVTPVLVNTTVSVLEDSTVGTSVGTLTISSIGDGAITSIDLNGTGSTNFSIDTSGAITTLSSLDYEVTNEYNLTAVATNLAGTSNSVDLKILVNDVIDTPATLAASTSVVDENATDGTYVGDINITDTGDSAITVIELSGTGSENFVVSADGNITVANGADLDFEGTGGSYALSAIATNAAGDSASVSVTITINDSPEIPVLQATTLSIMENELDGATVGSITILDSGDSPITDVNLSGVGFENFTVDTAGLVTLDVNSSIDYETTTEYNLTAVATNAAGASAGVNITINIDDYDYDPVQIANNMASDGEAQDYFGISVDISGDYIVVGAASEDASGVPDAGSAYLFKKEDNGSVSQVQKLSATINGVGDNFGKSVAIDGNTIVVGAPNDDSTGNAYIFTIDANGSVSAPTKFGLAVQTVDDTFGEAVDISGKYIIVGAPNKAAAYLFDTNGTWVSDVNATGVVPSDEYGASVAMDGDYIVIGASDRDDAGPTDSGSAFVFYNNAGVVSLVSEITAPSPAANDFFGISVGISGNYVVVGAYQQDDINTNAGSAYLYKITSTTTISSAYAIQEADTLEGDYFGYSVGIDGIYLSVGASRQTVSSLENAGSAYIYEIDTTTDQTTLIKKVTANTSVANDLFGSSIAVGGDFTVVGAINYDANNTSAGVGSAYIYDGEPAP